MRNAAAYLAPPTPAIKPNKTMENTIENKAKFMALYYGQDVMKSGGQLDDDIEAYNVAEGMQNIQQKYLLLTPLSAITDEEAIEIHTSTLRKGYNLKDIDLTVENHSLYGRSIVSRHKGSICGVNSISDVDLWQKEVDMLRQRGFAVPYLDLSVNQQIEYGWVKLKTP